MAKLILMFEPTILGEGTSVTVERELSAVPSNPIDDELLAAMLREAMQEPNFANDVLVEVTLLWDGQLQGKGRFPLRQLKEVASGDRLAQDLTKF